MNRFLQFSIGAFLLLAGTSLVIASVQPAYGERGLISNAAPDPAALKILYVNIDTVNNQYKAFVELADTTSGGLEGKMAEYQKLAEDLQIRYATLQERVNMGTISTDEAVNEEAAVNQGLDRLKRLEAELAFLEADAMAKNDSISAIVAIFFKEYAEKNGVDYVLMYGTGMPVIYASPAHDVTKEAVAELNMAYDRELLKRKLNRPGRQK